MATRSGDKTGRSPKDKRIVVDPASTDDVWWGDVNIRLTERSFLINRQRAIDYLNTRPRIFVFDGYAGWDPAHQIRVRVIAESAYHALFMHNMLIRPSADQLESFGDPDVVILNAGGFPANPYTAQMTSKTSIDLSIERGELVILGTQYAGEMKKGVFTVMNYLMPKKDVLRMHCSANTSCKDDVTLFFGLSGTGKTTLSTDPNRQLTKYAELLADRIRKHNSRPWLVNTGWTGGPHGVGSRMSLKHTRAIIDAIHDGTLNHAETRTDPVFDFEVPTQCGNLPAEILWPRDAWPDGDAFDSSAQRLADLFRENFRKFESGASEAICNAGPT